NTTQVLEWLGEGTVPLGTVEGLPRAPRMRLEPFLQDELLPVVASAAPAELFRVECAEDLARVPIVWREVGSGSRAVVERALHLAGARRPPHPRDLAFGSNDAVRTAVSLGLGVAFLSKWTIQGELASGLLVPLDLPDLRIQRSFAWAIPAGHVGGIAGEFLEAAQRMAAEWWPSLGIAPKRRGASRAPRRRSDPAA
ncbi:MAG TPA: LysR substrate-binding domain-containing protein, partial [Anaeromyxobacteraceae bacterium]|nr:LysR substrate-binding domain-containing protein [Anaeromyxobacteraceae bacterium]